MSDIFRGPLIFRIWRLDPNSIAAQSQNQFLSPTFPGWIPAPAPEQAPFIQTDWPVPRGTPNQIAWLQRGYRVLVEEFANEPRSPVFWRREPLDASRAQTQPLGSNLALITTPVAEAMPFNQYNWPNPRGPAPVPQDFHASFPLPLQEVIQPNQYDWPVPKGPPPLNLGMVDYILPWAQAPPINQLDWPVPRGPRRNPQDWADSFKLPLQQTLPLNQYSWPNPPLAAKRNPQDWLYTILPNRAPTGAPFFQTDWPNPRGPLRGTPDWEDSFKLPLQQTLPFNEYDWPNPVLPIVRRQDWRDSFKLPLQQTLPPRQLDWPNPVLRIVQRPDWILPQPYALNVVVTQTNPGFNEWAVPDRPQRRLDWIFPQPYTLNVVANPFVPQDWPVPRGPQRLALTWTDSFKLPLQQTLPLNQYDWPVPRGPRRGNPDWDDSFKLPLQQTLPENQYDWPNPVLPIVRRPDWTWRPLALLTAPPLPPINQTDWPVPKGPRRGNQDWELAPPLPLQVTVVDPAVNQMGNPILPVVRRQGWVAGRNLALNAAPFSETDWPNPIIAKRNPQDWVRSTPVALTAAAQPFVQTDWPVPRGPRRNPQDWDDSFKLPLQQNLPENQYSWPNPPLGARRNLQDWTSTILPNRQPTGAPFSETDWPVPRGPRRGNQSWEQRTPQALLVTVTDPAVNQMGNPILPIVRRQDWIKSVNTALNITPPIRQYDWPNPRGRPPLNVGWLTLTSNPLNPPPPPAGGEMLKNERIRLRFLENQSVSESGRVRWLKNEIRR